MPTSKTSKPRKHIAGMSQMHLGAHRNAPGMADGGFVNNAVTAMKNVFTRKRRAPEPEPAPAEPAQPAQQTMSLSNASGGMKSIMDKRRAQLDNMADGGKVRGPGTGTSDSIPVNLSKGEYVLPADTTKAIGVKALDAIKDATHTPVKMGAKRGMANGGAVSALAMDEVAKRRAADMAAAKATLKTQSTPMARTAAAPAAAPATAPAPATGKAYGAGQRVGAGSRTVSGLAAKSVVAAPLAGFGDYQINDPEVDSSAMGTLRAVGSGDFGMAGRSLQKGAVEAGLDTVSGLAKAGDFIAGIGGFKPDLTGRLAGKVQGDLGSQVTIDPSTASPVAPSMIPTAAAATAPQAVMDSAQVAPQPAPGVVQEPPPIIGGSGRGTVSNIQGGSGGRSTMEINQNASRILGEMAAVNDKYQQDYGRGARRMPTAGEKLAQQKLAQEQAQGSAELGIKSTAAKSDEQLKQGQIAAMNQLQTLSKQIDAAAPGSPEQKALMAKYQVLSGKQPSQSKVVLEDFNTGELDMTGQPIWRKRAINAETGQPITSAQPAQAPSYPEGQKLKGRDGKMYVVKNGVPVLA